VIAVVLVVPLVLGGLKPQIRNIIGAAVAERIEMIYLAAFFVALVLRNILAVINQVVLFCGHAAMGLRIGAIGFVDGGGAFPVRFQVLQADGVGFPRCHRGIGVEAVRAHVRGCLRIRGQRSQKQ